MVPKMRNAEPEKDNGINSNFNPGARYFLLPVPIWTRRGFSPMPIPYHQIFPEIKNSELRHLPVGLHWGVGWPCCGTTDVGTTKRSAVGSSARLHAGWRPAERRMDKEPGAGRVSLVENKEQMAGVSLLLAAAGSGVRFGGGRKVLASLSGLPLFAHCLRAFLPLLSVDRVRLIVPAGAEEDFREALVAARLPCDLPIIAGGETRAQSVLNGLESLPVDTEIVAVQDAARPGTTAELLLRCVLAAREWGAGVAAYRVTDTIKLANTDGLVQNTPDRNRLWAAETPQVFRFDRLLPAYRDAVFAGGSLTDDAQVFERAGYPVQLVENTDPNPKITYRHDLDETQ